MMISQTVGCTIPPKSRFRTAMFVGSLRLGCFFVPTTVEPATSTFVQALIAPQALNSPVPFGRRISGVSATTRSRHQRGYAWNHPIFSCLDCGCFCSFFFLQGGLGQPRPVRLAAPRHPSGNESAGEEAGQGYPR